MLVHRKSKPYDPKREEKPQLLKTLNLPWNARKLFLGLVLTASLLVVLVTATALLYARNQVERGLESSTANLANTLALTFESKIDTIDVMLQSCADEISRRIAKGETDVAQISAYLEQQMGHLPTVILRASDAKGDVVYVPGPGASPTNIVDREYFVHLRDHPDAGLFVSRPVVGKINGKWIWLFARRITTADHQFGGVVFARIDVDNIDKLLMQIRMEPGSSIGVRDASMGLITGRVSSSLTYPIQTGDTRVSAAFTNALRANPLEGTYKTRVSTLDEEQRTFSYKSSARYGFIVNVSSTGEVPLGQWQRQAWATGLLASLFVALMLGFSALISTAWRRQDQSVLALRQAHETLETRIAQRTEELEQAMRKLQGFQEELTKSEARATISMLVASVSHELSTPIGNSVMVASTLKDQARSLQRQIDTGSLKRSDFSDFLSTLDDGTSMIESNLQRSEGLLRTFRQVSADQASEQRRSFDLRQMLLEVLKTVEPSTKRQPHRVVLHVPEGILMDSLPGPIGQVAINLINNAYLHAFEGRNDGVLEIDATQDGRQVTLSFVDNGAGMTQEQMEHLFEPFFSTKIGRGGTGLGMAIVDNLVTKSLAGRISVRSTPGQGSRFDITLPLVLP